MKLVYGQNKPLVEGSRLQAGQTAATPRSEDPPSPGLEAGAPSRSSQGETRTTMFILRVADKTLISASDSTKEAWATTYSAPGIVTNSAVIANGARTV